MERLGRELAAGAGLVLILDYDGTLTPIVPSPHAASLAPTHREMLRRLAENPRARLAILSGRSLRDIKARVGLGNVVYGGCHGLEIEGAGFRFRHPVARARRTSVGTAARLLARQLDRFPGVFLERKGLAVSLHYRRVPWQRRSDLFTLGARVERRVPGLTILPGKNVVEFVPRVIWGKGEAALWIASRFARSLRPRRVLTLYAGDDATDAAAFAALKGRGVTVRVGAGRGRADYAVKNVRGMYALLRWIGHAIGRRTRSG